MLDRDSLLVYDVSMLSEMNDNNNQTKEKPKMDKHFRIKTKDGESFWFSISATAKSQYDLPANLLGEPLVVGFKVDRTGYGSFTTLHFIHTGCIEWMRKAEKVNEFTCGHKSADMVEGKCPRCADTSTGHFMVSVLQTTK